MMDVNVVNALADAAATPTSVKTNSVLPARRVSVAPMSYLSEIGAVAVSDDLAELIQCEGMLGCKCISPAEFQT